MRKMVYKCLRINRCESKMSTVGIAASADSVASAWIAVAVEVEPVGSVKNGQACQRLIVNKA